MKERKIENSNLLWFLWRHRKKVYLAWSLLSLFIIIYIFGTTDSLEAIIKCLNELQKLNATGTLGDKTVVLLISAGLPASLLVVAALVLRYHLLPHSTTELLDRIGKRKAHEVRHLARVLIEKEIDALVSMMGVEDVSTPIYKLQEYAEEILKASQAETIFMTTLKEPRGIHEDNELHGFNKQALKNIKDSGKTLKRYLISDSDEISKCDCNQCKWFRDLHCSKDGKIIVKRVGRDKFKRLVETAGRKIERDKLDIFLFDGSVIFGIKNNDNFETKIYPDPRGTGRLHADLFLMEDQRKLREYSDFLKDLDENSEPAW